MDGNVFCTVFHCFQIVRMQLTNFEAEAKAEAKAQTRWALFSAQIDEDITKLQKLVLHCVIKCLSDTKKNGRFGKFGNTQPAAFENSDFLTK